MAERSYVWSEPARIACILVPTKGPQECRFGLHPLRDSPQAREMAEKSWPNRIGVRSVDSRFLRRPRTKADRSFRCVCRADSGAILVKWGTFVLVFRTSKTQSSAVGLSGIVPLTACLLKCTDTLILPIPRIEPLGHIGGVVLHMIQSAGRFTAAEEKDDIGVLPVGREERPRRIGEGAPRAIVEPRNQLPPFQACIEML